MSLIAPAKYKTPDGVERPLRFTFGAQRRIVERLGCTLGEAMQKYGAAALPEILYCCMFDRDGKPPEGLNPSHFIEDADPESHMEMLAALEAACPPGKTKNEFRAMIQGAEDLERMRETRLEILGSMSGASPDKSSGSEKLNSGTESPSPSSTPSASDTSKNETSGDAAPV